MKHLYLLAAVVALGLATAASAATTTEAPRPDIAAPAPAVTVAVLTGRWKLFFGSKICWGQVVNLPGESQCV